MKAAKLEFNLERTGFLVGLIGFLLLVIGIGCVYWPAGLIAAGVLMLAWSAMAASAAARAKPRPNKES